MDKTLNEKQIKTIQNFWRWVEDNQTAIFNAYVVGINTAEVAMHFKRNLNYVSKQIDCLIFYQDETLKLLFTVQGYRKLFPKLIALKESAPKLSRVTPTIFIKPITNKERYLNKEDGYLSIFQQILKNTQLENLKPFSKNEKIIAIASIGKINMLNIEDVIYCEADVKYTKFYLNDDTEYVSSRNIGEYENLLILNSFFRIHYKLLLI
jgi:hypothetical protein